ncbi:MAG TPA: sensor histidine kinase [Anaerolineaceae bacterium]
MQPTRSKVIRTGSGLDLAFAVVVLASYFATFSALHAATNLEIGLMIGLGIAYITIGIYGYKFVARSNNLTLQIAYFLLQIPLGSLIVYLGRGAGFNMLILLPLAGHAVVLLTSAWLYVTNLLLVVGYFVAVMNYSQDISLVWASLPTFLAGVVFIMVFTQMAIGEERARLEVERLAKDLAEVNARLVQYAQQAEELAVTKERNRLAREIHDGLGHYLTSIYMQIQAALATAGVAPERSQAAMEKAQTLAQEALVDVRHSVAALHAQTEESLPLTESIGRVLPTCEAAGITAALDVRGAPRELSPQAHLSLFRAVQEAVNNACKHSHASRLDIALDYTIDGVVCLSIVDDGIGADIIEGGYGLIGLRERVNLLNGTLKIISSKGQGFSLEIMVPG